jgi:hypothetical protein
MYENLPIKVDVSITNESQKIYKALEAVQTLKVLLVWMYTFFNIMTQRDNIFPFSQNHTLFSGTYIYIYIPRSWGSSVSTVTDYGLDDWGSIPDRGRGFFFCIQTLGPTQPPVQWEPGVLSLGVKRSRGVTLTTPPHLVQRLRMSRSYTSSPPKHLHGM